jgi:hypothetical protein
MKQLSAYYGKKVVRRPIWQPGYYDQILRDAEATMAAITYVVNNPVRAGLVKDVAVYEFIGSSVYTMAEFREFAVADKCRPDLQVGRARAIRDDGY